MNTMLATNLVIVGRGWSVTVISICAVFITGGLMLVFVPLGRHLLGEGGECAGASSAIIGSEICVLIAMISRFHTFPFDERNVRVFAKSAAIGAGVLILDRFLRPIGAIRLAIDATLYAALAFVLGVVRPDDLKRAVRLLRHRGDKGPAPVVSTGG
jgi:hypothetical protein